MNVSAARWLLCALPALLGGRDPFQPPEDSCRTGQLAQWRYHGVVDDGQRSVGLLRDGEGKWRRVGVGQRLATGWRITRLTVARIEVATGVGCEPAQWVWIRQGENDETRDRSDGVAAAGAVAGKGKKRLAGGG